MNHHITLPSVKTALLTGDGFLSVPSLSLLEGSHRFVVFSLQNTQELHKSRSLHSSCSVQIKVIQCLYLPYLFLSDLDVGDRSNGSVRL